MLLTLLLLVSPPPSSAGVDNALRDLETQNAKANGKQEKSLEAIEKAIKHQPAKCPKCPTCIGISADEGALQVKLSEIKVIASSLPVMEVRGEAEVWKTYPPPPEKIGSAAFSVPFIPPPPKVQKPLLPTWAWIVIAAGAGVAVGAAVTGGVMAATRNP